MLDILVDPASKAPLQLEANRREAEGDILEGVLRGAGGRSYRVTNGIPRFVLTDDGLSIVHFDVDRAGFTVRAIRQ